MEEIWVTVKGYEGLYEVSNLGRVRSLTRMVTGKNGGFRQIKGIILKNTYDNWGYPKVHLSIYGKKTMYRIHKLVAEHFIEKPYEYKDGIWFVNRKDGDPNNNRVDNLYWVKDIESLGKAGRKPKVRGKK